MGFFWFILGVLILMFLAGCHRRYLEYRLKREFLEDQKEDLSRRIDDKVEEFFKFGRKED